MVALPPRTDIRARLDALPDSIPPGAPDDDGPSGAVIVWCVLFAAIYILGIVLIVAIRSC